MEQTSGGADLTDAQLGGADLRWASLVSAKLQRATFYQAHLAGADLFGANLEGANLEALRGLPDPEDIAGAENLEAIRFNRPPTAVQLREAFKRGGFRQQERQLTYAIKRRERIASGGIEGAAMYVLFELPCLYGMAPGRPLWILLAFIGVFSVPYTVALGRQGTAGIWAVPLPDRVHGQDSGVHPIRVTRNFPAWTREIASASSGRQPPTRPPQRRWRGIGSVVFGAAGSRRHRCAMFVVGNAGVPLYFSVVSAFHLGWRDLNVGSWVSRIQPREYSLRATGWVRTMAGIQSVISVYLVALWALSYFGRPFE